MTAPVPLEDLFAQLEAAVRAGDRDRAVELEREIARRLASEVADAQAQALRLRALMAQLDAAGETPRMRVDIPAADPLGIAPAEKTVESAAGELGDLDLSHLTRGGGAAEQQGVDYPVWFATNRKPWLSGGFGGGRGAETLRGRVTVHVPNAHRFGETGSGFWTRFWSGDDRLRMKEIAQRTQAAFYDEIHAIIQEARDNGDEPEALVFLHGYNVSFADAAIRAAQIGYDLKIPGATAFFSWPSRGDPIAYAADEASIEASERAIADFLVEFAQNCGAAKLHLIAHSMGNRGLLRALQRIAADAAARGKVRFHQMILAAPDVDRDLFLDLAHLYSAHADRATLYASGRDLPVHLSSKWHDAPRAGYFEPYTVAPGVDTVAVPNFDIDLMGHGYFAQAEAMLHDIFDLMRFNQPPAKRQRIDAAQADGLAFWRVNR
jgi:esterase/lipase superfamily enzyme